MSGDISKPIDLNKLPLLRLVALGAALIGLGLSYWLLTGFDGFQWLMAVISFVIAALIYSGTFYFGCLILSPGLADYIVSDDTVVKGERVEMVTTTRESGNEDIDRWVKSFTNARSLFAMAIVPLLLLAGLFLFA